MTVRSPSTMIPGEWEQRGPPRVIHPADGPIRSLAQPATAIHTAMTPAPLLTTPSSEWPLWARVSLFVGLLFAAMFLAMWGASRGPS